MPATGVPALTLEGRPLSAVGITVSWPDGLEVWCTRVTRTDGACVMGADPLYTPGGAGYAQDNVPPLGLRIGYRAIGYDGIHSDPVAESAVAEIDVPPVASPLRSAGAVWLKAARNPSLSMLVVGVELKAVRKRPLQVHDPLGAVYPILHDEPLKARTGTLTVVTLTSADRATMRRLLEESPLVLVQPEARLGFADMWAVLGGDQEQPVGDRRHAASLWPLDFTEVGPPDTTDSPVLVPGWSYAARDASQASYQTADTAFSTYNSLTKGP